MRPSRSSLLNSPHLQSMPSVTWLLGHGFGFNNYTTGNPELLIWSFARLQQGVTLDYWGVLPKPTRNGEYGQLRMRIGGPRYLTTWRRMRKLLWWGCNLT